MSSAARGDVRPCIKAGCQGQMQFGRKPSPTPSGGATSNGAAGWVCSASPLFHADDRPMITAALPVGSPVVVIAVLRLRRRGSAKASDLGAVSEAWLAEEKTSGGRRLLAPRILIAPLNAPR